MDFKATEISGVWVIDPAPHVDDRGRFMRAWCSQEFAQHEIAFAPVQANMGYSLRVGTVRGMHFQRDPSPEAKLVRCTRGAMFDVVVDLRPESPTWRHWYGVELTPENGRMLYLPERCAHGYQTLVDHTEMHYMTSAFYDTTAASGVRFDDPALRIVWPLPATAVSDQDRTWPLITE